MCFDGGDDQYNAYEAGDYAAWKSTLDQRNAWKKLAAEGRIDAKTLAAKLKSSDASIAKLNDRVKQDPSANMEMREVTRQGDIGLGKIGIDKQFSKFDPKYYDKYKADYQGYYTPDLADQYANAQGDLTANLADRGMLDSTVGIHKYADLSKENADARANIANEANDAAKKLRGTVENAKSNLYNLNQASADPQAVNAQAVGQATALVAPPTYSPLGKVFADFLNGLPSIGGGGQQRRRYASPYSTSTKGSDSVIS